MRRLFTRTFFHFLTAFLIILALSFVLLMYIGTQAGDAPTDVIDTAQSAQ